MFSLEADCTIPAEYILMMHFMDEIDTALERRIANFLRNRQVTDGHGGWPLYYGGDFDMSCSVKVYYALKLAGDSPEAAHMVRARNAILEREGLRARMYLPACCWPCTARFHGAVCRLFQLKSCCCRAGFLFI